jgi:hypothetical protein
MLDHRCIKYDWLLLRYSEYKWEWKYILIDTQRVSLSVFVNEKIKAMIRSWKCINKQKYTEQVLSSAFLN